MAVELPKPIRLYLRGFVLRRRAVAFGRSLGWALAAFAAWMLLSCILDRFFQLSRWPRAALLSAGIAIAASIVLWSLVRVVLRPMNWLRAAAMVERYNPVFGERLRTVVSQFVDNPHYRGSSDMLQHILTDVQQVTVAHRPSRRVRLRSMFPAWIAAAIILTCMLALSRSTWLDLPSLSRRFLHPLRSLPSVTTTRLIVDPAGVSIVRSEALLVRAHVYNLNGPPPVIFTSQNGLSWTRITMAPAGDDEYTFVLPAVDRDLWYYVVAGDATSPTYKAIVLRPPAVMEYRIRYDYPPYTERGQITVSSTDGLVECLAGTKTTISVVATEPLSSATLAAGRLAIPLQPTADPAIRQAELTVQNAVNFDLEMLSLGGLKARVPGAITIRPQPDREPLVRMIQPADDLRLQPRDTLAIQYQASDDFALADLWLSIQVNTSPPTHRSIPRRGEPRRQEGQLTLDLASLPLHLGDVVSISLAVQDGTGRKVSTEPRHLLIAPNSVAIDTRLRLNHLQQALYHAGIVTAQLAAAADALTRAATLQSSEGDYLAERLKATRALASSIDAAQSLHQALLQTVPHSESPQHTVLLATCIDRARTLAANIDRLAAADAAGDRENVLSDRLRSILDSARQLAVTVTTLSTAAHAAVLLAEQANLAAPTSQPADRAAAEQQHDALRRAQRALARSAAGINLNASAADFASQLRAKIDALEPLLSQARPISFEQAAHEWASATQSTRHPIFVERLASSAIVEAIRPDSEPEHARDLQLAARAATRLADSLRRTAPADADRLRSNIQDFPKTLAAIQRLHRAQRRTPDRAADPATRSAATAARAKLAEWAGQPDDLLLARSDAADLEDLAMQASADMAQHEYGRASSFDARLAQRFAALNLDTEAAALDAVRRSMSILAAIDAAAQAQEHLLKPPATRPSPTTRQSQREILLALNAAAGLPLATDSRDRALAAIAQAQDDVAQLPRQLADFLAAANTARQAIRLAESAQRFAATAPPDRKAQAADDATRLLAAAKEAEDRARNAAPAISAEYVQRLNASLQPFLPETQEACATLSQRLLPALRALHQATRSPDPTPLDRLAAPIRPIIDDLPPQLTTAQNRIILNDPLAAARWFADAAADALPDNFPQAQTLQKIAAGAFSQAWLRALRHTAAQRLSLLPSYRAILAQPVSAESANQPRRAQLLPGLRFQRPRPLGAPAPETEPPIYNDSVRIYFDAINRMQQPPKK